MIGILVQNKNYMLVSKDLKEIYINRTKTKPFLPSYIHSSLKTELYFSNSKFKLLSKRTAVTTSD
jgi:hypothetical protein